MGWIDMVDIMIYYKSYRIIDGKPQWVITDENCNIIKNPTKEQLKIAIFDNSRNNSKYNRRTCCDCGNSETYIRPDGIPQWYSCECDKINCTRYLCKYCWSNDYQHNTSYSSYNIAKLFADWRNGNLDPSSTSGKGFIGQQIAAKRYDVEDCNLIMDNFHFYIDLSKISEHGYCEVKISSLYARNGQWQFHTDRIQEYDNLFAICMDKNWPWKSVERVYMIPWEIVVNREKGTVTITKNSYRGPGRYDEFMIDEKSFNDAYHKIKLENCKVLRKR